MNATARVATHLAVLLVLQLCWLLPSHAQAPAVSKFKEEVSKQEVIYRSGGMTSRAATPSIAALVGLRFGALPRVRPRSRQSRARGPVARHRRGRRPGHPGLLRPGVRRAVHGRTGAPREESARGRDVHRGPAHSQVAAEGGQPRNQPDTVPARPVAARVFARRARAFPGDNRRDRRLLLYRRIFRCSWRKSWASSK